jgi:hypothetical protein
MTPSNRARVALLTFLTLAAGSAAIAQDTASCDRRCLQGIADRYLAALVAHDPTRAPLAPNIRITENGQRLGTEHGLWKTAAANSKFRLYLADPEQGAVGFIGLVMENHRGAQHPLCEAGRICRTAAGTARAGKSC